MLGTDWAVTPVWTKGKLEYMKESLPVQQESGGLSTLQILRKGDPIVYYGNISKKNMRGKK